MSSDTTLTHRRITRRAVVRGGVALAGSGAIGLALGRGTRAQDATATVDGIDIGSLGLPELKIAVGGAGYEGVPSSLAAGRYLVTVTNNTTGSTDSTVAGFIQLPDGVTAADLSMGPPAGSPAAETASPAASPAAGDGGGAPPWFYTTNMAGGPSAQPGETGRGIVDLVPGNWAVWGEDPTAKAKPVALTVTGDASATPTTGTAITAAVTVEEVKTGDGFAFQVDGSFQAGKQLVEIRNHSDQPHFMLLIGSPIPLTMDQVQLLLQLPDGATPEPSTGLPDPSTFKTAVYAGTQSAGSTQWIETDLKDGTYVLLCFIGDPTKHGLPHAAEGMATIITVGRGSATPIS